MKNCENNPQYLNVFDILKRIGLRREFSFKFHITDFLGTEMGGIAAGEVAEFKLVLASVSDGIYLSGTILVNLTTTCSRCLKTRNRRIELRPQAFYLHGTVVDEENLDENLYSLVNGHYIDLLEILRDSLFEKLEFNPVCDANCTNQFLETLEDGAYEDSPFAELRALKEKL